MAFLGDFAPTRFTPTAIQDNSATTLRSLKEHLRISLTDTSKDRQLNTILAACKESADEYCNRSFLDLASGQVVIPSRVEVWIKMQASNLFEWATNGVGNISEPGFGSVGLKDRMDTTLLRNLRFYPGF